MTTLAAGGTSEGTARSSLRRNRDFLSLWGAVGLANLADGVFQVVLPVVLIVSGAPLTSVPLVLGASRLPWAVLTLHAGVLADRFDRRGLLALSYGLRGGAVATIAAAVTLDWPLVPVAVACALCVGSAETIGDTTAHSLTPSVVPRTELVRANGALQSTELSTNLLIGPACAGFVAAVSPAAGLVVVGVLYVAAALGTWPLPRSAVPRDRDRPLRVTDGLRHLLAVPKLRLFAVAVGLLNLAYAVFQSGLPLKVVGPDDGEVTLGLYWGASGLVCLLLGGVSARLIARFGACRVLLTGVAGLAVGFSTGGITDNSWVVGVGAAMTGGLVLVNVVTVSYRQSVVPAHLLGRVTAAYRLIAFGAFPVGSLVAGLGITWLGVDAALLTTLAPVCLAAALFTIAHQKGESHDTAIGHQR
ncbi:hypothetical protein FHU38_004623 [Saccharomonospora amisosensis]|uniref:MFS transporter n=1 Tax=Saccharomonospora amisosensis TaxID=1128677 RepID=A0A7X5UV69_9PSEU|nr:MFS transporter [Saccharomonospora amisosensis]NIJ14279.1 hypothetical protein [Saccharomonospora amisosensis]